MMFFVLLSGLFINPITGKYVSYVTVDEITGEEKTTVEHTEEYNPEYLLDQK